MIDGKLLFRAVDGTHGREWWTSDGTKQGTVLVKDAKTGDDSAYEFDLPADRVGDLVYYRQVRGSYDLWRTDGTSAGTFRLWNVPRATQFYYICLLPSLHGALYFGQYQSADNSEGLWKSSGTPGTTVVVKVRLDMFDVFDGEEHKDQTVVCGDSLFIAGNDGVTGMSYGWCARYSLTCTFLRLLTSSRVRSLRNMIQRGSTCRRRASPWNRVY